MSANNALTPFAPGPLIPNRPPIKLKCDLTGKSVTMRRVMAVAVFESNCVICGKKIEHVIDGDVDPSEQWAFRTSEESGGPSLLCPSCEKNWFKFGNVDTCARVSGEKDRAEQAAHHKRVGIIYDKRLRDLRLSYRRAKLDDIQYREAAEKLEAWRMREQPGWTPVPDNWPSYENEEGESDDTESLNLECEPPKFSDDTESAIASMTPADSKRATAQEYHAKKGQFKPGHSGNAH